MSRRRSNSDFYKQRDKLDAESKNRTATMEGELAVLKKRLVGGGSETGFLCRERYPDGDGSL